MMSTTTLLLLVVGLVSLGWSTEGGQIAATSSNSQSLTLSVIDPISGSMRNQLFKTTNLTQPVAISAAIDFEDRTTYIPVLSASSSSISVLGLEIDDDFQSAGVVEEIVTPLVNINSLGWDYGLDQLLVIGQERPSQPYLTFWMVQVPSGFHFTFHLPITPATNFTGGGGATSVPSVFSNSTRSFIFPSFNPSTTPPFSLVFFNIDTLRYTISAQQFFTPIAMAHDPFTDTIYAIFASASAAVGPGLAFGTIDPRSFSNTIIKQWPAELNRFSTVIGGVATVGSSFYVLLGDSNGNNPTLATVSLSTGLPTQLTSLTAGVNPLSLTWLN